MEKITRRNFLKAAGISAAVLGLTACGSAASASTASSAASGAASSAAASSTAAKTPVSGGTLRLAYANPISTPGYTPRATGNALLYYLTLAYENLLTYDKDGSLVPKLATEWSVDNDEPSITWTLREGVTFADGTAFNADAVKRNIEEYQTNSRTEVSNISECVVIDDTHIKMIMTEANSSTLEAVGFFVFYMSPKALDDVTSLDTATCGTGPFQLSEFENNAYATYKKNENYWQEGLPYLDGVEITVVTEASTASTAFRAGEYDMVEVNAATPTVKQELDNDGIYITENNTNGMGVGTLGVIPNSAMDSPWADVKVRRALCYAIDCDALNTAFLLGTATLTDEWAVPGAITYNDDLTHFSYNPDRAKELLSEAGYADGFDTQIVTVSTISDMFTSIANMLNEVGIRCEINQVDGATQNQMYMDGTWEGLMPHWTTVSPDLGLYMGRHLDVNGAYYAKGIQHPDKEMQLLAEIRSAMDSTEKVKLEKELQAAIYDAESGSCLFGRPLYVTSGTMYKYDYVIDDKAKESFASAWDLSACWLDK